MLRPNLAMDKPPAELTVGGNTYPINVDYRIWLNVLGMLRDLDITHDDQETVSETLKLVSEMETIVFGNVIRESPGDVISAMAEFLKGYPSAPINGTADDSDDAVAFSYDYDLNEIILAIRNQSGIDLSYRRTEPFHWWEFLLEFHTLAGNHYILNLINMRTYKGKDKEMLKAKAKYRLPDILTKAEQREMDAFSAMFDEGGTEE